jgi:hypothetical protein
MVSGPTAWTRVISMCAVIPRASTDAAARSMMSRGSGEVRQA